jgi:hypothetical protein
MLTKLLVENGIVGFFWLIRGAAHLASLGLPHLKAIPNLYRGISSVFENSRLLHSLACVSFMLHLGYFAPNRSNFAQNLGEK